VIHIQRFIERLQGSDARGNREFSMSMSDAKNLHADITRLLLQCRELQQDKSKDTEVIEIQVQGGGFR
jgi:hypothetical protein